MSVNLVKLRKVTPSNSNPSYEPLDSMEFGDINNSVNDSPNSSERFTRPSRHFLIVPFLVFIWYLTAVFAITSSKMIMNIRRLPFLLCTVQFLSATLATWVVLRLRRSSTSHPVVHMPSQSQLMFQNLVYPISVSYTLGFIFTNIAFSLAPPSFAETVKSAEPISSVALGFFFFNEGTTPLTYATLLPICLGVGISCVDDATFHMWGFVTAALSNICFSSRAVISKRLFSTFPGAIDEIQLFAYISRIGLLILVPMTILVEASAIKALLLFEWSELWHFGQLLVFNGIAYSIYNLMSFLVLSRTDLVTHAVLNVFRRVFIIGYTSWFFSVHLSVLNSCGVALAVAGVLLFALSKHREQLMRCVSDDTRK